IQRVPRAAVRTNGLPIKKTRECPTIIGRNLAANLTSVLESHRRASEEGRRSGNRAGANFPGQGNPPLLSFGNPVRKVRAKNGPSLRPDLGLRAGLDVGAEPEQADDLAFAAGVAQEDTRLGPVDDPLQPRYNRVKRLTLRL